MSSSQVMSQALRAKIMSADDAAALVKPGSHVGMSGFTGSGYPKAVPLALARRIEAAHGRGEPFRIGVWTGASTAPELDGALAKANGIDLRLPYQSDPTTRQRINAGSMEYIDLHLSHVAQFVWFGFLGHLDIAVIECAGILPDGRLIPSTSIGNNKTWLDQADRVIIEVNSWMNPALLGMHDVYYGTRLPPHRKPIPIIAPGDRIGETTYRCNPDKIIAVVETHAPDRNTTFTPPDEVSGAIAGHILEFFEHEVKQGRLPRNLLPLQSGVGNVANAVMAGLDEGPFPHLTAYTEVLQDGMLNLIRSGRMDLASATALSLSSEAAIEFNREIEFLRDRIVLRPQEISNHPEVIRRLGVIAMNGLIEADIYGNVNSTHVRGSSIMNGIGGSGDFARNAYLSIFMTPSTAKNGAISCIVPMVTHVDHTEHDVQILVTEHGLADLRGLSPKQRARAIIDKAAHAKFRPALSDYFERACRDSSGKHTPHLLDEALRVLRPE
ncbi:succinyl-CoA:acetate CoA-transferase [Bradyrhizobium sp. USDA 4369]